MILSHAVELPITAESDTEKYRLRGSNCQQSMFYSLLQFIIPLCVCVGVWLVIYIMCILVCLC